MKKTIPACLPIYFSCVVPQKSKHPAFWRRRGNPEYVAPYPTDEKDTSDVRNMLGKFVGATKIISGSEKAVNDALKFRVFYSV